MHKCLAAKKTAKVAWDSLKAMRTGSGLAKHGKIQQLWREFELLAFKDGEGVEDFSLRLSTLVTQLAELGQTIEDVPARRPEERREDFAELDTSVTGSVKLDDGLTVTICVRGTVVFKCQNDDHHALTDVYYTPELRTSIASLGQLDERGCEVLIKRGVLNIRDRELHLLTKVKRSANRLYLLKLNIVQPVCLASVRDDEAWLWHARFGHLSFEALARMLSAGMVRGLPRIEHVVKLCDRCLVGKQRRSLFAKKAKYRRRST
ncbi:hypothetical protein U9M48_031419 [Paspalum notatum var. saurae]|uniref:GAG-pre-integrase domain-containing protein n=1 Tax=Paspalum notatum var. saurae TaxID=547442 RepID=A0AAQ3X4C7_PASNO